MFEFDQFAGDNGPERPTRPTTEYAFRGDIDHVSLLRWGEHCVECQAPTCYATCDLYEKRPDQRCRRFVYGIRKNTDFRSFRGYGAEIVFKKWGRLQARGNLDLQPVRRVLRKEGATELVSPAVNGLGRAVAVLKRDFRFNHLLFSLIDRWAMRKQRSGAGRVMPDAFLLELYNPTGQPVRIQLEIRVDWWQIRHDVSKQDVPPPFQVTLEIPPGYFRQEFDHALYRSVTDSGHPFDVFILPEADEAAHLVFLAADFVKFSVPATRNDKKRPGVKCIVWDLDNTVWDGVLIEQDDVALKPGIAELLRRLDERGILSSIASKNAHDHAWAKLEQLGIAEFFLYPKINWLPKSENVRQIARDLNIGLDTFAFVDDNPFEREQVKTALPEVQTVDEKDIAGLLDDPRMKGSTSSEARNRRRFYQDALLREAVATEHGPDILGFLAASEITLAVRRYVPEDHERAVELVQRTNQLNFSGRKYSRDEISQIIEDDRCVKFILDCRDRFGSYGKVGFSIVRPDRDTVVIEDFMLSCRVQGKYIEQAFFDAVVNDPAFGKPAYLRVNFRATDKNQPAQDVLKAMGFEGVEDGRDLVMEMRDRSLHCDFIRLVLDHDPATEAVGA